MLDHRAAEDFVGKPEFEIPPAAGNFEEYILPSLSNAENAASEQRDSKPYDQRKSPKKDAAPNRLREFSAGLTSENAAGIRDDLKKLTPYKLTLNESTTGSKGVMEFKGGVPLDKKLQAAYAEAFSSAEPVSLIHGKHLLHVAPDTDIANEFEEIRGLDSRRGNKPFHVEESAEGRRLVFDGKSIPKQAIKTAIEESRALHKPVELTVNGIDLGTLHGNSVVQDLKSSYDELRKAGGSEPARSESKSSEKSGAKASIEKEIAPVRSEQSPEPITADKAEAALPKEEIRPAALRSTLPSTIVLPREIAVIRPLAGQNNVPQAETPSPASVHKKNEVERLSGGKISGEPKFDFDWGRILHPGGQQEIVTPKSYFQALPPREMPHDLSAFFDQGAKTPAVPLLNASKSAFHAHPDEISRLQSLPPGELGEDWNRSMELLDANNMIPKKLGIEPDSGAKERGAKISALAKDTTPAGKESPAETGEIKQTRSAGRSRRIDRKADKAAETPVLEPPSDSASSEGRSKGSKRQAIGGAELLASPRKRSAASKSEVDTPTPSAATEQAVSAAPETPVAARHIEFDPATLVVNEFRHPSGYSLVRDTVGQSSAESMMQSRYRIISDKGEQIGIFSGRLAVNEKGALHAFPRRNMIGEELTRFDVLAKDLGLKKSEPGKSLSSYVELSGEVRAPYKQSSAPARLSGHQELIENGLAPMMEGYDRKLNFFYPAMDESTKPVEAQLVKNGSQEIRPEEIILHAKTRPSNSDVPIELVEASELGAKSEAGGKTKRAAGKAAAAAAVTGAVLSATTQGAQALGILK